MRLDSNVLQSSVFFVLILVFATYYEYANGQNLSVSTDRPTYNVGDIVTVFVTAPAVAANVPVTIQLLDPINTVYTLDQLIAIDGTYSSQFQLVSELAMAGSWTVRATYDDQEAFNSFVVVAAESRETIHPFAVRTDKDKYVGSEIITVSGTVPFVGEGLIVGLLVFPPTFDFPSEDVYIRKKIVPASDGTYSFDFTIDPSSEVGTYTVLALYNDETRETTFDFTVGVAEISIKSLTPNEARWGLDSVTVEGRVVYALKGATVTVEWGDGTSTPSIPVSDETWGPVSHVYDAIHVGKNQIVAKLIDELRIGVSVTLAETEPHTVNVVKHSTQITLNAVNELVDNRFTVSGRLYDADADKGITDETIILSVSTVDREVVTTEILSTNSSGYYLIPLNLSGDLPANELLFQAYFAGDDQYLESSDVQIPPPQPPPPPPPRPDGIPPGLPEAASIAAITVASVVVLKNVPKPRRRPNIPKDSSVTISVRFEVDIKR